MGLTPEKARIFSALYAFGSGFFCAGFVATGETASFVGFLGCAVISGFFHNRGNN